jgi:hypothetical protein
LKQERGGLLNTSWQRSMGGAFSIEKGLPVGRAKGQRGSIRKVAEEKAVKKISAKAIMAELRAGSSDTELMKKYDISYGALQDIFSKLTKAGLATQAYFDKRALKQSPAVQAENSTRTCPHCGFSSATPFAKCPRCEQEVSDWLNTMELTNILTGSFH